MNTIAPSTCACHVITLQPGEEAPPHSDRGWRGTPHGESRGLLGRSLFHKKVGSNEIITTIRSFLSYTRTRLGATTIRISRELMKYNFGIQLRIVYHRLQFDSEKHILKQCFNSFEDLECSFSIGIQICYPVAFCK